MKYFVFTLLLLLSINTSINNVCHVTALSMSTPSSSFKPKGSAATPLVKRKVAVLGTGGYLASLVFGYLQRAGSLYGTGIAGSSVRGLGATSDAAVRLNSILSKHFVLAFADESFIKLTDLQSVDALQQRLTGWDALILGNSFQIQQRPVTSNTYEKTPNDKAYELYWDGIRGQKQQNMDAETQQLGQEIVTSVLKNVLQAAQQAGIKHIVGVDHDPSDGPGLCCPNFDALLEKSGIPYTCLYPMGPLVNTPDYSFQKGIQGRLSITPLKEEDKNSPESTLSRTSTDSNTPIAREDLAALCVQILLSCSWSTSSRRLWKVSCGGSLSPEERERARAGKRNDQEWCVASAALLSGLGPLAS